MILPFLKRNPLIFPGGKFLEVKILSQILYTVLIFLMGTAKFSSRKISLMYTVLNSI